LLACHSRREGHFANHQLFIHGASVRKCNGS
jgi:hypothetical protein